MKNDVYQKEREKLREIFKDIDPAMAGLAEGLIDEAAFIKAQNEGLREGLAETGMVKIHPEHKGIQKPMPAAREYRQNVNSYAVLIKTLNGILQKNPVDEEDPVDKFIAKMNGKDDA